MRKWFTAAALAISLAFYPVQATAESNKVHEAWAVEHLGDIDTSTEDVYVTMSVSGDSIHPYMQMQGKMLELAEGFAMEQMGIRLRIAEGKGPNPERAHIHVDYLSDDTLSKEYRRSLRSDLDDTLGFVELEERRAYIGSDRKGDRRYRKDCPAGFVLLSTETFLHEIGHNLGLYHIDDEMTTHIPDALDDKANMMVPYREQVKLFMDDEICDRNVDSLTLDDLPMFVSEIQKRQVHSFLDGGKVWRALESVEFDFDDYVERIECYYGGCPPDDQS